MYAFSPAAPFLGDTVVEFTVITPADILVFEEDFGDTLSDAPYWSEAERRLDDTLLFDPQAHLRKRDMDRKRQEGDPAWEPPEDYWQLHNQLMRLVVALSGTCVPDAAPSAPAGTMAITIDTRQRRASLQSDPMDRLPATLGASVPPTLESGPLHDTLEDAVHYAESIIGEFQDHYQRFDRALDPNEPT